MVKTESSTKIQSPTTNNNNNNNNTGAQMSQSKKRYKGVRMRSWGSWVSEIRAPNQKTRIWLGSYSTPEAAARAYDAALLCLKGSSASFNFPLPKHSLPNLPHPDDMSPKSIQRAAAAAAFPEPSIPSFSPSSSSSSSLNESTSSPSPSFCSSSPAQVEDDRFSLAAAAEEEEYRVQLEEPGVVWYNFDSPKYNEMLNGVFFDPSMMVDCDEDSDIRLWSFC